MSCSPDWKSMLVAERWFGGKCKPIASVHSVVRLPLVENADWHILEVRYEDGTRDLYQMPLLDGENAFARADFREQVFAHLQENRDFSTVAGSVKIRCLAPAPDYRDSRFLTIEQSNSSVAYGDTSFLKIFRKLEPGINPDIEILTHLTRMETPVRVPTIFSTLTLEIDGESFALAVLLEMVGNRGNAWEVALEAVQNGDDFIREAALLGRRTAEMHLALGAETAHPDFGVIASTDDDWQATVETMRQECDDLLVLLTAKLPSLNGESATLAAGFLASAPDELARHTAAQPAFPLVRIHGDYHLGQVLVTGEDFIIIDFEGEPARPLAERRQRRSPLIDVAGMLRSFHYAGCMAGNPSWSDATERTFLDAYLELTAGSHILPDESTTRSLLDVFAWQKKLYEIRYELNNRPDWLWIPLK